MASFNGKYRIDGYLTSREDERVPVIEQIAEPKQEARVDLRALCSPVEDQGTIGSCTANAIVGAVEYIFNVMNGGHVDLSRLFVYYNARRMSDRENEDCGSSMAHAMAAFLAHGACPEEAWSYDPARWNMRPSDDAYNSALMLRQMHYGRVAPNDMRKAMLLSGLPIIFGMGVPEHLMMTVGAETGYMPAPADGNWEEPSGGHAMLIVGFDDAQRGWIVRNSWGPDWGVGGHVLIDYDVMDYYAQPSGYWVIAPYDQNQYFRLLAGARADDFSAPAPGTVANDITSRRQSVRQKIEQDMDETRESIRDRLRGPGAGGGYDKGPGAGGGYDQGPGAGGGYDRGPGAGGGYDRGPGAGGGYEE